MLDGGRPQSDGFRQRLEFVTTAQMSVDAQATAGGMTMNTFHFVGDVVLIVIGVAFALVGYVLGYLFVISGVLFLFLGQAAPLRRWQVRRHRGALLGQPVTVDVDESGMQFATPLTTSHVPWSTITSLRVSDRSILFYRDRTPLGYLPAAAFNSDTERQAFVEYARGKAASSRAAAPIN
jgi:hypothetical protein